MNKQTLYRLFTDIAAAVFIFLFCYTALSKLYHHSLFIITLAKSPLLSGIASYIAWTIPVVELVISALLLFPRTRKQGFRLSFLLMGLFSAYILYMLLFSPSLPCSCGGIIQQLSWGQHLALNLVLTGVAFLGIIYINRSAQSGSYETGEAENLYNRVGNI